MEGFLAKYLISPVVVVVAVAVTVIVIVIVVVVVASALPEIQLRCDLALQEPYVHDSMHSDVMQCACRCHCVVLTESMPHHARRCGQQSASEREHGIVSNQHRLPIISKLSAYSGSNDEVFHAVFCSHNGIRQETNDYDHLHLFVHRMRCVHCQYFRLTKKDCEHGFSREMRVSARDCDGPEQSQEQRLQASVSRLCLSCEC